MVVHLGKVLGKICCVLKQNDKNHIINIVVLLKINSYMENPLVFLARVNYFINSLEKN